MREHPQKLSLRLSSRFPTAQQKRVSRWAKSKTRRRTEKELQEYVLSKNSNKNVQMWMNVQLLESVLKLASIDSGPTNATASTATKRSLNWDPYHAFLAGKKKMSDLSPWMVSISDLSFHAGPSNRPLQGRRWETEPDICSQDRHAQAWPGQVANLEEFFWVNICIVGC